MSKNLIYPCEISSAKELTIGECYVLLPAVNVMGEFDNLNEDSFILFKPTKVIERNRIAACHIGNFDLYVSGSLKYNLCEPSAIWVTTNRLIRLATLEEKIWFYHLAFHLIKT